MKEILSHLLADAEARSLVRPFQINLLFLGPDRLTILIERVEKTKISKLCIIRKNAQ